MGACLSAPESATASALVPNQAPAASALPPPPPDATPPPPPPPPLLRSVDAPTLSLYSNSCSPTNDAVVQQALPAAVRPVLATPSVSPPVSSALAHTSCSGHATSPTFASPLPSPSVGKSLFLSVDSTGGSSSVETSHSLQPSASSSTSHSLSSSGVSALLELQRSNSQSSPPPPPTPPALTFSISDSEPSPASPTPRAPPPPATPIERVLAAAGDCVRPDDLAVAIHAAAKMLDGAAFIAMYRTQRARHVALARMAIALGIDAHDVAWQGKHGLHGICIPALDQLPQSPLVVQSHVQQTHQQHVGHATEQQNPHQTLEEQVRAAAVLVAAASRLLDGSDRHPLAELAGAFDRAREKIACAANQE